MLKCFKKNFKTKFLSKNQNLFFKRCFNSRTKLNRKNMSVYNRFFFKKEK